MSNITVEQVDNDYIINIKLPIELYQDMKVISGYPLEEILGEALGEGIVAIIQEKFYS